MLLVTLIRVLKSHPILLVFPKHTRELCSKLRR